MFRFYFDNIVYPMTGLPVYQDNLLINPFYAGAFQGLGRWCCEYNALS